MLEHQLHVRRYPYIDFSGGNLFQNFSRAEEKIVSVVTSLVMRIVARERIMRSRKFVIVIVHSTGSLVE